MKISKAIILIGLPVILLTRCTPVSDQGKSESTQSERLVTSEQRALAGVATGEMQYRVISSVIPCTGEIEVPPQGMASVTAPLGGYIVDIDIVPGTYVKKGAVLARMTNPEYIVLQQSYLETLGQMKFAAQDYERQKSLVEQNAAALKKLQESEASYNVMKARLAGLKQQLGILGVNIQNIEQGNIQSEIFLKAPIAGYVTEVNHHQGQFVEPREVIFHIVDLRDLHLHLNVFERDVANVSRGQAIRFRPSGANAKTYWGEVSLVSPKRNEEIRTFDVHGHIEGEDDRLKPGMYIEAEILTSRDSVYAIQETAMVRDANETFIVAEEEGNYRIIPVDTGARMDGWVEIRNAEKLRDKKIVIEGATRVFTALRR